MKKLIVLGFVSILFISASKNPKRDKLVGVWKLQTMELNGVKMRHEQMSLPYMEFNKQGGFLIKLGGTMEKGRYKLKGDTLSLKFIIPLKVPQQMIITKLDTFELDYTTTDSLHNTIKVQSYRITKGLGEERD